MIAYDSLSAGPLYLLALAGVCVAILLIVIADETNGDDE